jgi:hypothetical protein
MKMKDGDEWNGYPLLDDEMHMQMTFFVQYSLVDSRTMNTFKTRH